MNLQVDVQVMRTSASWRWLLKCPQGLGLKRDPWKGEEGQNPSREADRTRNSQILCRNRGNKV